VIGNFRGHFRDQQLKIHKVHLKVFWKQNFCSSMKSLIYVANFSPRVYSSATALQSLCNSPHLTRITAVCLTFLYLHLIDWSKAQNMLKSLS